MTRQPRPGHSFSSSSPLWHCNFRCWSLWNPWGRPTSSFTLPCYHI